MTQRRRMLVSGTVQGVCYRMATQEEGRRLGVRGWVRNRPDGAVEVVAEGDPADLDALEAWCRTGPPMARVRHIRASAQPATGEFDDFRIAY